MAGFAVGSLVRARGREWVVQPGSDADLLVVRPLGGGSDDLTGILVDLERPEPATFALPQAHDLGDDYSARLLRDALRIGFRSSAGPFRCMASLGFEPRPYQLVPLLLALRQDPVRLLIADEVGVGKTIEAGLVAAELLATGAATGLSVLCPPSLAEQWRAELAEKFGIHAQVVQPGTVRRLERGLGYGESLFDRYPHTVVSTDFVKADRRRDEFLRAAPDLLIVDEAHTCVTADGGDVKAGRLGGQTQRFRLLTELAATPQRHLLLVTATPHSGVEAAFRNLVGLLDPALGVADLSSAGGRELLARHMVQRRRANLRSWLAETRFPSDRLTTERPYQLSRAYRALFDDVLAYVHGQVSDGSGTVVQQRVRWWSALGLLRAVASSPQAAAATLTTRVSAASAATAETADELGSADALDLSEDSPADGLDVTPGALADAATRELVALRDQALALTVADDAKLVATTRVVRELLADGYHPIVFCRFIATAHAVAQHLRGALRTAHIDVVTGDLTPDDRAVRVEKLAAAAAGGAIVLVATDCLSEGVNLQRDYQAVVHYDLAWNPTRHEQREGRVDRFGQQADQVRAVTVYGADNGIDGIVMQVLLRKHRAIRAALGVDVPVPAQAEHVIASMVEGLIRRRPDATQLTLDFEAEQEAQRFEQAWRSSAETETQQLARYAHRALDPDEVMAEVQAAREALGAPTDVAGFVRTALAEFGGQPTDAEHRVVVPAAPLRPSIREALGSAPGDDLVFHLDLPAPAGAAVLVRTDPMVGALARAVLEAALDPALPAADRPARRAGVLVSADVAQATVALLVRLRMHLTLPGRAGEVRRLAEEARVLAFTGSPAAPRWLTPPEVERLLSARPGANLPLDVAVGSLAGVLAALDPLTPHLEQAARTAADELRDAHARVRRAARRRDQADTSLTVRGLRVEPQLPVDVLGVYLYRPLGVAR